jgi:large subunit ribosomal protein L32
MAVPTGKKSKSKKRMRRANHDRITLPDVTDCTNCGSDVLAHHVCPACGHYRGREVVVIEVDDLADDAADTDTTSA